MADVNFTIHTKMGSLLTFKIKGTPGALAANEQIQEIFTFNFGECPRVEGKWGYHV